MYIERESRTILKATVDTTHVCNLDCDYCLQGWKTKVRLPADKIRDTFSAAESNGLLEVFLSGAETTLHPELEQILEDTHILEKTGSTLITNGTTMTPEMAIAIGRSNIKRVCISIDGADSDTHNSLRGNNFDRVLKGLYLLQDTGKPITVLSVAHQRNKDGLLKLSEFLASRHLANQHNITAVSRSGLARDKYDEMRLTDADFHSIQAGVDSAHETLQNQGLDLVFTSYWLATGNRSQTRNPRELTLFELSEQLKNCNVVIRVNGDVQLTTAAWAREFLVDGVIGNIREKDPSKLFSEAGEIYSAGGALQLPREAEAREKYGLGGETSAKVDLIPVIPIGKFDLLGQALKNGQLEELAAGVHSNPDNYRLVNSADDIYVLFDKGLSHVTLLRAGEAERINTLTT